MLSATLRCFGDFGDVRCWSPGADHLATGGIASGWHDVDGVFTESDGQWIAVVRVNELMIARPTEQREFSEIESVEVTPLANGAREIRLRFRDSAVWTVEYRPIESYRNEFDPTPFTEPEDFDFGEYLRLLVLDSERHGRVFRRER